jgi:catechol 2,3-dioxygenase-like lactoylglutathione lyase family enzyme
MPVLQIDHVNIAGPPSLIEACRRFYVEILGLTDGARPPFRSRGHWLYADNHPIVHLTERGANGEPRPTGALDHVSLKCDALAEMMLRLTKQEVRFKLDEVPDRGTTQLFLEDPAGIRLELNFDELVAQR